MRTLQPVTRIVAGRLLTWSEPFARLAHRDARQRFALFEEFAAARTLPPVFVLGRLPVVVGGLRQHGGSLGRVTVQPFLEVFHGHADHAAQPLPTVFVVGQITGPRIIRGDETQHNLVLVEATARMHLVDDEHQLAVRRRTDEHVDRIAVLVLSTLEVAVIMDHLRGPLLTGRTDARPRAALRILDCDVETVQRDMPLAVITGLLLCRRRLTIHCLTGTA